MNSITILSAYLAAINLLGFAFMGIDKRRSIRSAFRIPEATLFAVALLGGSLGCILGMHLFKHKTKHWYFLFGMPIILILQLVLIVLLYFSPIEFSFM